VNGAAQRVVVVGGSGFVGRHLVARLAAAGHDIVVPTRRREAAKHLILLPTVEVVEADVFDRVALARLLAGATAVVNLVGILNESGRTTFTRSHVELARTLTAACAAAGIRRFLQMSALHADPAGPSRYLRSKGEAEAIVRSSPLGWTIFRPSVIFGPEDSFLNLFARVARLLPVIALASPNARFQPVYVGDVAHCMAQALTEEASEGENYDLCGPGVYTLRELVRYVGEVSGAVRPIIPLGAGLSKLQATVLEMLPGQLMSRDNLASMSRDSVCDCPFPATFGILPTAMEAVAPEYLAPAAMRSHYAAYRAGSGR
jgi:NADH dehydrogenase